MNLSWLAPAASPWAAAPASPGTKWTGSPAAWVSTARDGTARHGTGAACRQPPARPSAPPGGRAPAVCGDPGVPGLGAMRCWPRWEGGRKARRRRRREGMPARNLFSFKPSVARAPAALASFVLCFPGVSSLPCSRQFPWVLPPSGSRDPWPGGVGVAPGRPLRAWPPGAAPKPEMFAPNIPRKLTGCLLRYFPEAACGKSLPGALRKTFGQPVFPSLSEDGAHRARSGPD